MPNVSLSCELSQNEYLGVALLNDCSVDVGVPGGWIHSFVMPSLRQIYL